MGKVDLEKLKELMLIAKHGSDDRWGYRLENKNDLDGEFVFVFDLDGLNARGIHVYRFAAAAMNAIPDLCEELKSSLDKIAKLVSEINTMLKEEEIYGEANTLKLAKLVEQIETEQFLDTALKGWEVFK